MKVFRWRNVVITLKKITHQNLCDCIYSSWNPKNTASKLLFESFGFVETGDLDGDIEDDEYEVVVMLEI